MAKGLTELTSLNSAEVSLVDKGANKKKRFPIFKQEDLMDKDFDEILKAVLETEVDEESDLEEWFEKANVSPKGMAAVKSALRMLSAYKDELPKDALDKLAAAAGYPSPKQGQKKKEDEEKYGYPKPMSKESVKKWLEGMPEELRKQVEYTEPKEEEVKKFDNLPEEVQAVLKAREDELEAIKAKNEEVTKALAEERDKRELEEWTAKAEKELSHYPGKSTEELGKMLKTLHDSNPEVAETQFESMKAASEAIKKSALLAERGSIGASQSGSAWDKINKIAAGIVEKSADNGMTKAAAIAKALNDNPELYEEYLAEHPRQTAPSV